jgi:hypothetical protein
MNQIDAKIDPEVPSPCGRGVWGEGKFPLTLALSHRERVIELPQKTVKQLWTAYGRRWSRDRKW